MAGAPLTMPALLDIYLQEVQEGISQKYEGVGRKVSAMALNLLFDGGSIERWCLVTNIVQTATIIL